MGSGTWEVRREEWTVEGGQWDVWCFVFSFAIHCDRFTFQYVHATKPEHSTYMRVPRHKRFEQEAAETSEET